MKPAIKQFLSEQGRKGGKATGAAKVRGDSDYYKRIRAKREEKRKSTV